MTLEVAMIIRRRKGESPYAAQAARTGAPGLEGMWGCWRSDVGHPGRSEGPGNSGHGVEDVPTVVALLTGTFAPRLVVVLYHLYQVGFSIWYSSKPQKP